MLKINFEKVERIVRAIERGYKLPESGSFNDEKRKRSGWLVLRKVSWDRNDLVLHDLKYRVNKLEYLEIQKRIGEI